jgi:hypothetical protein
MAHEHLFANDCSSATGIFMRRCVATNAGEWRSCASGPRASGSLMKSSARQRLAGPEEREEDAFEFISDTPKHSIDPNWI